MGIRFPVVKLIDFAGREEELKNSDNPFGIMTFAFLKTRETRDDMEQRRRFKMQATRALYEKNYTAEEVRLLYRTIDWMMTLPAEQEIIYLDELNQLEAEKAMPYVSSAERISMNRGLEQGRQEGRQEGRKEGFASLLMAQLSQRFGQVPDWVAQKLTSAPPEALENWGRRVLDARSFDEIFA